MTPKVQRVGQQPAAARTDSLSSNPAFSQNASKLIFNRDNMRVDTLSNDSFRLTLDSIPGLTVEKFQDPNVTLYAAQAAAAADETDEAEETAEADETSAAEEAEETADAEEAPAADEAEEPEEPEESDETEPAAEEENFTDYTVKKGDCLWKIAFAQLG